MILKFLVVYYHSNAHLLRMILFKVFGVHPNQAVENNEK